MAAVAVLRNETLQAFLQVCAQLCSLWLLGSLGNSLVPFVLRFLGSRFDLPWQFSVVRLNFCGSFVFVSCDVTQTSVSRRRRLRSL